MMIEGIRRVRLTLMLWWVSFDRKGSLVGLFGPDLGIQTKSIHLEEVGYHS